MSSPTQPVTLHPFPHPHPNTTTTTTVPEPANPLPPLLHTPSGLALLELQGTINLPALPPPPPLDDDDDPASSRAASPSIAIGRLHFPDYRPDAHAAAAASTSTTSSDAAAWMKRVWLYVGSHQRLQGEVRKLPRAVAVLRRRPRRQQQRTGSGGRSGSGLGIIEGGGEGEAEGDAGDGDLEVVAVVKYKVVFSSRPEPVGGGVAG